jgi:DNA-binding transcriptional regulator PaaX
MKKKTQLAGYKATVSRLRTLLLREGVNAGSLNRQTVGNASRYTLTDKADGKTRCLYIPVAMEAEVRRLAGNWKELKSLALEMSEWTRRDLVERIAALTGRRTVKPKKAPKGRKAGRAASQERTRRGESRRKG